MSRRQTPSEFLKKIVGQPVVVKLNSGADYRGSFLVILLEIFKQSTQMVTLDWD